MDDIPGKYFTMCPLKQKQISLNELAKKLQRAAKVGHGMTFSS